jgi:large subunit ribosomal protein L2
LIPGVGGKLLRSAGVYGKVWRHENYYTVLRLRSGEERLFFGRCRATVGVVSHDDHHLKKYYKAGVLRKLGVRPTVRGIAMNPVDHPNGGRTKGGFPFTDNWGNLSKGGRTACKRLKLKNRFILKSRVNLKR